MTDKQTSIYASTIVKGSFQVKMVKVAIVAPLVALVACVADCSAQAAKHHPVKYDCRSRTINETLTMVLLVGSDMRTQGKHPTWGDISNEVARRMKK